LIVKGPVCVPGMPDIIGEVLSDEEIGYAILTFNRLGQTIDVQHSLQPIAKCLESYRTESESIFDGKTLPKNTWMITGEIIDPEIEQAIRDGEYTGWSVTAAPKKSVEEMRRGVKIPKKEGRLMTFKDIEDRGWSPATVSAVDKPSQPLATFKVYEDDEEFVKKYIDLEVDSMTNDENENEKNNVTMSESFFERLFGGLVHKTAPESPVKQEGIPEKNPEKNEEKNEEDTLEAKIDNALEKIDKIETRLNKIENQEEEPEGEETPAAETVAKSTPKENLEEPEEEAEEELESQEVDPDLVKKSAPEESLLERVGRQANGLPKK
jgi:hypothetical protein